MCVPGWRIRWARACIEVRTGNNGCVKKPQELGHEGLQDK